ncbi:stage II sporulation protein M [Sphingomonas ginkgonis]|uniref:Stage II sporulation protein M n=1 Tax=Sphingomonas ginkgonis TaxID=2315330 RepID=A0A429V9I3_9SPHN|nr:stage II sporulation protein M [Sphingomonas ginkgonis]RST30619.1 stage II sporulation protein M [Sphingomonas ginkgonis]
MSGPLVNATRFRAEHSADWERLDQLVTRLERKSLRSLSDDDLLDLPRLYRSTLSSLSVARDTSLDRSLLTYLEQLSTRAYFQIYGVQTSPGRQVLRFFARGWPLAIQALWRELLFCAVLTAASALAAFLLVRGDPDWFYGIIPQGMAAGRDPAASTAFLRGTLYGNERDGLMVFATFLFTHNAQIAIFAFALGFAFAVPSVLLITYNGLMLGAIFAVFAAHGLAHNLAGWLLIHGTTELLAICVAGAAGIRIGLALAFPGAAQRMEALVAAGRTAATAMLGAVLMLSVAGILEGVGRQTITDDGLRLLVGAVALAGWLLYFFLPRRTVDEAR